VATAGDYGLFVEAMCNYGVSASGRQILSKESIDLMRRNWLDEICMQDFAKLDKRGYGYGLGVRTMMDRSVTNAKSPVGEFGWDGAAGAYVMIDVENRVGIFYAQQVLARDVANIIQIRIRDMVYECLEEK
jgi:CubicO group peptidase (beta-lactamase class C family)